MLSYGVGYAAYANAYLIFILPHSIITVSVMTGLLPRLSGAGRRRRPARRAGLAVGGLAADRGRHRARGRGAWSRSGRTSPACCTPARRCDRRPLHRPGHRGLRPRPAGVLGAVHRPARLLRLRGHPHPVPAAGGHRGHQRRCSRWARTPCSRCAGGWSASRWPTADLPGRPGAVHVGAPPPDRRAGRPRRGPPLRAAAGGRRARRVAGVGGGLAGGQGSATASSARRSHWPPEGWCSCSGTSARPAPCTSAS